MSEEKEKKDQKDTCMMPHTGSEEDPNLCCCYIVDFDGTYVDPCFPLTSGCC